jgi:5-methylcytosine-specific restriction enzyme subunit McrC
VTERRIIARDCSLFRPLDRDDDDWLRRLVAAVKPVELLLPISEGGDDDEPVAIFDSAAGLWRAGRFVGEISFNGGTLRIEPRFGMPALTRWLGTIWGVRLVESKGVLRERRFWLWLVIAHLWAGRLIAAAKHGLPYRRMDAIHKGRALRGKLLARETALARAVGDDRLVSLTRARIVDPTIGGILLAAFDRLLDALGGRGERAAWLPDRGKAIIDDLHAVLGSRAGKETVRRCSTLRYTPITEGYRSAVDLSLSILTQRPRAPATGGEAKAYGILLDMAEIWELYVAKLLHIGLPGWRVAHTGRTKMHFRWLLTGAGGETFGSLRPDILILDTRDRCLGIADAKYKTTRFNASNTTGVLREDLYQLAAYLSGFGEPDKQLDGFLIYPDDPEGQVVRRLYPKSPWKMTSASRRNLWFLAADGGVDADMPSMTESERIIVSTVRTAILSA